MQTIETILARRAVRAYKPEPIPESDLQQILEAGRQAPSASNRQPWHFVVVRDHELRRQVAELCGEQMWMADAAVTLVACGNTTVSPRWYKVDVAIALENMVLAAKSLGYGTCWIGRLPDPDKLKALLGIPAEYEIVNCLPIGVPDASPDPKPRKSMDEAFSQDKFGTPVKL